MTELLLFTALLVAGALIAVGTWAVVEWQSHPGKRVVVATTAYPVNAPAKFGTTQSAEIRTLQMRLREAGYSIQVNGRLDPVAKSAAADFLRVSSAHPLAPWLASALTGTVLTGRRDPAAWNARFGLDRATRMVERPLTGSNGQLDAYGNVRPVGSVR